MDVPEHIAHAAALNPGAAIPVFDMSQAHQHDDGTMHAPESALIGYWLSGPLGEVVGFSPYMGYRMVVRP